MIKTKRYVALMLAFTMTLFLVSGFTIASASTPNVSTTLNSTQVQTFANNVATGLNSLTVAQKINLYGALSQLRSIDKNELAEELYELITESNLKEKLEEYGLNDASKTLFLNELENVNNMLDLTFFISNLLDSAPYTNDNNIADLYIDQDETEKLGDVLETVYTNLLTDSGFAAVYSRLTPEGKSKIEIAFEVLELVINNVTVSTTAPHNVTINQVALKNGLNAKSSQYFGVTTQITDENIEEINNFIDGFINNNSFTSAQKSAIAAAFNVVKAQFAAPVVPPVVPPGTGGGGGGGGGAVPPQPIPGQVSGVTKVVVGENGQSVVTVDQAKVVEAIDNLIKSMNNTTKNPVFVLNIEGDITANASISLPSAVMTKLVENNITLVIDSKVLRYRIPAGALKDVLKGISADAKIEFNSVIIEPNEIKGLIKDNRVDKVAKVLSFSLEIIDNGKTTKVTKFSQKITIEINIEDVVINRNLAGVFFLNEQTGSLKFVGGKIKDGKILMSTNHYSKYIVAESVVKFTDIKGHYAESSILSMAAKNVINGYSDGTFKPQNNVTRAEFVKMLLNALEIEVTPSTSVLKDVPASHWAKDHIATARALDIVAGFEDGTFRPDTTITRAQMVVMISRVLKLDASEKESVLNRYTDANEVPVWARGHFTAVVEESLIQGSLGMLNPQGKTTRAEAATVIQRLFNR